MGVQWSGLEPLAAQEAPSQAGRLSAVAVVLLAWHLPSRVLLPHVAMMHAGKHPSVVGAPDRARGEDTGQRKMESTGAAAAAATAGCCSVSSSSSSAGAAVRLRAHAPRHPPASYETFGCVCQPRAGPCHLAFCVAAQPQWMARPGSGSGPPLLPAELKRPLPLLLALPLPLPARAGAGRGHVGEWVGPYVGRRPCTAEGPGPKAAKATTPDRPAAGIGAALPLTRRVHRNHPPGPSWRSHPTPPTPTQGTHCTRPTRPQDRDRGRHTQYKRPHTLCAHTHRHTGTRVLYCAPLLLLAAPAGMRISPSSPTGTATVTATTVCCRPSGPTKRAALAARWPGMPEPILKCS